MKKLTFILFILLILSSCKFKKKEDQLIKRGGYSITLPYNLEETSVLNEDASLQFMDSYNSLFVVIIDEKKGNNFDNLKELVKDGYSGGIVIMKFEDYTKAVIDDYKKGVYVYKNPKTIEKEINGLPAKIIDMNSRFEETNVFMRFVLISGKKSYYRIMIWTEEKKISKLKETFDKIGNSFKEL